MDSGLLEVSMDHLLVLVFIFTSLSVSAGETAIQKNKDKTYPGRHQRLEIEILKENIVFTNEFATLYNDQVKFPYGKEGTYLRFTWNSPTTVAILPILGDGSVVMIEHFRHALRDWTWEIPRGMGKADKLEVFANTELLEETGLHDCKLIHLGPITPDSGILSTKVELFLGLNCIRGKVKKERDDGTIRNIMYIMQDDLRQKIESGEVCDAFTIAAMYKARKYLENLRPSSKVPIK